MFIARVNGTVVTTQKVAKMTGRKLLVIEPMRVDEKTKSIAGTGRCLVAVDALDAGKDDLVLVTQGSSARLTEGTSDAPVDCVVIGIVDTVFAAGTDVYRKDKHH